MQENQTLQKDFKEVFKDIKNEIRLAKDMMKDPYILNILERRGDEFTSSFTISNYIF